MPTIEMKVQIMESLGHLDQVQSEKVLEFIQSILQTGKAEEDYLDFKNRAMTEIRNALNGEQGPKAA